MHNKQLDRMVTRIVFILIFPLQYFYFKQSGCEYYRCRLEKFNNVEKEAEIFPLLRRERGRGDEAVCKSFLCASFDVKFIRQARSSITFVDLTEGLGFHAKGFNTKT